ncbi:MAG: hypothetical protein WCS25_08505 [Victivallaceae bacterium]
MNYKIKYINDVNITRFTLVELLVTISVIALLAALMLPALSKAREKSKGAFCESNLKQLNAANLLYVLDYGYYMPCYGSEITGPGSSVGKLWIGYRSAPAGTPGNIDMHGGFVFDICGNWKIMTCPSWNVSGGAPDKITDGHGYGYNVIGIGSMAYITGSAYKNGSGMKVEMVKKPSSVVLFGDVTATTVPGEIRPYSFFYPKYTISSSGMSVNSRGDNAHFRHAGAASVGWADGHVSRERPSRLNNNFVGSAHWVGNFGPPNNSLFEPWRWTGAGAVY